MDNIDIPAATEAGILVGNVPGANSAAVAEVALLHILNIGRRFSHCTEGCRNGIWPSTITGNELDGKTVGLLGFGNIGKQLVRMMKGFDVKVLVYDAYFPDQDDEKYGVTFVKDKEELFRESDILSLHVPFNEETKGMIDKNVFAMMKPTAYLINTCRGGVINEEDLIQALKEGQIQGAGLDVLVQEPPEKDNSQVIIGDCIADFFAGNVPYNVKNKLEK